MIRLDESTVGDSVVKSGQQFVTSVRSSGGRVGMLKFQWGVMRMYRIRDEYI